MSLKGLVFWLCLTALAVGQGRSYPVTFVTRPAGLWVYRYLPEARTAGEDECLGQTGRPLSLSFRDEELSNDWILYFCYAPPGTEPGMVVQRPEVAAMTRVRVGDLAGWQRFPQVGTLNVELPPAQWRQWFLRTWLAPLLGLAALLVWGGRQLWKLRPGPAPAPSPAAVGLPWEVLPGQLVGDYTVRERLGEGATAVVYRVDKEGESYALKLLKPSELRGVDVTARFRREMRALVQLKDPHLPYVLDYGEYLGLQYLVMELLSGESLADRLKPGPLEIEVALALLAQLAATLSRVHAQGVLHRDIKPENVVFGRDGRLKLTDFGLARDQGATTVTAEGAWLGTPLYMAPELFQGERASAASDQYSLGALAYQLLTGRPPFEGESPLALAVQHMQAPVPDPRTGRPAVDAMLLRMLAKAAGERYADLSEVAELLQKEPQ